MWRFKPAALRGALWAAVAARRVRRDLRRSGLRVAPVRAPRLPPTASGGVDGVLHRLAPTCLERALVRQAWLASQGSLVDVVIGVPRAGFAASSAHAWLDGADSTSVSPYVEVRRLSPHVTGT